MDFKFRSGDVLMVHNFVKWNSPKTWMYGMIRSFTKSYWNHVAQVTDIDGVLCVLESIGSGVVISKTLEAWLKEAPTIRNYAVLRDKDPGMTRISSRRMASMLGRKYDLGSLFFYHIIYRITNRWIGPVGTASETRPTCSELLGISRKEYFVKDGIARTWLITPQMIWECPYFKEVYKEVY